MTEAATEWWRKLPEQMTREELIARAQTVLTINAVLKREMAILIGENAGLHIAINDLRAALAAIPH